MGLFDGVPYDYSAEANRLLFTAGACPLDARGRVVAPGDLEAQTRQTVENLLLALAERGVDARSLVKTTIFVVASERAELVCVWEVIAESLGRCPSTLVGVSLLGYPDQLVEIEAIAHVDRE